MKRTQRQHIAGMLETMTAAGRFVEGREMEDLRDDLKLRQTLEQAYTIIGEAAKKVDPGLKARYPQIPWRDMADVRDQLVREYWISDVEMVWEVVHNRFPAEKPLLQRVLDELPPE